MTEAKVQFISMDAFVQSAGFKDEKEFRKMVVAVDLTNPIIFSKFAQWKSDDGSKNGLQRILDAQSRYA